MPMKAPNLSRFVVKPSKPQQEHLEKVAKAALENAENQFTKEVQSIVTKETAPKSDIEAPINEDTETPKNDEIAVPKNEEIATTETKDNVTPQQQVTPVAAGAAVAIPDDHEVLGQNDPEKKVDRKLPRNHERQLPQRPQKCHTLEHNTVSIFGLPNKAVLTPMERQALANQLGVDSVRLIAAKPRDLALEEFPQNDCIVLPNPHPGKAQKHSNDIVRIYGRYKSDATKSRKERQLIVSKKPIQLRGEKTCGEYCEDKADCICVNPQRDVAPFDEFSNNMEHGGNDKVAVYVTPPLSAGKKHIATIGNVIGFQEMRLFQSLMRHCPTTPSAKANLPRKSVYPIQLSGPKHPGKSVYNMLLTDLNGNLPCKFSPHGQAVKSMTSIEREKMMADLPINVVMKLMNPPMRRTPAEEALQYFNKHVVMTAIPIITGSEESATKGIISDIERRQCEVTEVNPECNLKLHGQWDWDIRIHNVGNHRSRVHLSTNEMPITERGALITFPKFEDYRYHRGYGCGCSFGDGGALGNLDLIFFPMLMFCLLSWLRCCKPREERTLRVFETDLDRPLRERKYAEPEEEDDRHIDEIFADVARKDEDIAGDV